MTKLNNRLLDLSIRLRSRLEDESGSQGIEAAGAALAAAIIVGALLGGAGTVAEAVTSAMETAASILGG